MTMRLTIRWNSPLGSSFSQMNVLADYRYGCPWEKHNEHFNVSSYRESKITKKVILHIGIISLLVYFWDGAQGEGVGGSPTFLVSAAMQQTRICHLHMLASLFKYFVNCLIL